MARSAYARETHLLSPLPSHSRNLGLVLLQAVYKPWAPLFTFLQTQLLQPLQSARYWHVAVHVPAVDPNSQVFLDKLLIEVEGASRVFLELESRAA